MFIFYLCNVYCIPYIFSCLPGLVQEQLGFCVLLHWVNPEYSIYLSFSCALYELHILPDCNWAFLTPLLRPSKHLERVEQGTHPWLGIYFLLEKDMLRLLDWKCEWSQNEITCKAENILLRRTRWRVNMKWHRPHETSLTWANSPMVARTLMTTPGLGSGSFNLRIRACKSKR